MLCILGAAASCAGIALVSGAAPAAANDAGVPGGIFFVSDRAGRLMIWVGTAPGVAHLAVKRGGGRKGGGERSDLEPAVSASGRIAFASNVDGDFNLYVAEPGGRTTQVTSDPVSEYDPSWSPDESELAFVRGRPGHGDIYLAASDGSGDELQLTHRRSNDINPAWSPDGQSLAFASNRRGTYDLWVIGLGGHLRQLTRGPGQDFAPAWSPDGTRIAFTRRNRKGNYDIYVVGRKGRGLKRLTRNRGEESEPSWSPDGNFIAYSRRIRRQYQIFVMTAHGKDQSNFSRSPGVLNISPSWHGGNTMLRAPANRSSRSQVTCTITGTPGNDRLNGTPSRDVICGGGGNDVIRGKGGDDSIFGDSGADVLRGGAGDDTIFGEPGRDRIFGGAGNDKIITNDGRRQQPISGGNGSDQGRTDGNPPDKVRSIEGPLGRIP